MTDPISRLNAALEGRYRIERRLGEGGMATAYLAPDNGIVHRDSKPADILMRGGEPLVAELELSSGVDVRSRQELFDTNELSLHSAANYAGWDVNRDDQHLFMIQLGRGQDETQDNQFVLVQNWLEEVRARAGGR